MSVPANLICQSNYINSANASLKQGDFERAAELYEKASAHCGESNKVKQNTAVLLAAQGHLDEALEQITESIKDDSDNASAYFNRAIIQVKQKDFVSAISDFKKALALGEQSANKLERQAHNLKKQSEEKQLDALISQAEVETSNQQYDKALQYYEEALLLRPAEPQLVFAKANVGLLQKNPFVSIEALESLIPTRLTDAQKLEVTLVKAYSLARINKMHEAVRLLENTIHTNRTADQRPRELLSYYYLILSKYQKAINVIKGRNDENPNVLVVAGNAALQLKNFSLAARYYHKVRSLDPDNLHAALGLAMCLSHEHNNTEAIQLIDSLAASHPDNHDVWNIKGIIHKDVGLYYKNNYRDQRANSFFVTSAAAFLTAQEINKHMKAVYESNRALALFFQNKKQTAQKIWSANKELSSQNNLALYHASQKDFKNSYNKLDSLYDDYWAKHNKKNNILDYNRGLARSRTSLNNNYKFLTNFSLNQDKPELAVVNPFVIEVKEELISSKHFEYSLSYSDKDCKEKVKRKRSKKKKRIKLFKRKKKKYNGDCPKF